MKELIENEILLPPSSQGVTFDDIAGLEAAKKLLTEAITLPLMMPEFFTGIREPWKGVLLYGPPGTGKTLLAKAIANTDSIQFFNCSCSAMVSKYRGDSEKMIHAVFSMARKAAPSIVFFDEADALVSQRGTHEEHEASRRFKSELLQEMDGVASGSAHVMVLATSNRPWDIDAAILRRFEKRIYIPLPDKAARVASLQLHLKGVECDADVDLGVIADALEGYSGADLRLICKDASMMFMRSWVQNKSLQEMMKLTASHSPVHASVSMTDFQKAMSKSSPSVRNVIRYESWSSEYSCV